MTTYPFNKLEKQYKTIPDDVREAISSLNASQKLERIGKKYALHLDKIDSLFDETGLVMLGLTHPKDYVLNLAKKMGINQDLAKKIAHDVNEEIFRPIRDSLKNIHNIGEPEIGKAKSEENGEKQITSPPLNLPIQISEETKKKEESLVPLPAHKMQSGPLQEEEVLDREKILREIEEPEIYSTPEEENELSLDEVKEKDIVEKKLTEVFSIPKESGTHTDVTQSKKIRPSPDVDNSARDKIKDQEKADYKGQDPYREPID